MAVTWPTSVDLQTFIEGANLSVTGADLVACVSAGRDAFERGSKWVPFLGTTQTRTFDAPGGNVLHLDAGLLTCTTVTVGGSLQVVNTDYWLGPQNADSAGEPWMQVEWSYSPSCAHRGIVIVGSWGRVADIPDSVRQAVLALGALEALPAIMARKTGLVTQWQEGDVREQYGEAGLAPICGGWRSLADSVIRRYRRVVIA